ncbi:MAG: FKBP-type peptidyl-prolyl cis-trans isomerase, partial [Bacteroidales bacterium]|nr:FKBP-type peptidyl-prolyl cis-trans isomerase [Bacteroidales bacterium]
FDSSLEDVAKENGLYNSARKYEPIEFQLGAGQMIRGFEIAAHQMSKGTKAMVLIPSSLAYGDRDMGIISPYSPLIFTMEVVDIQGQSTKEAKSTDKKADR